MIHNYFTRFERTTVTIKNNFGMDGGMDDSMDGGMDGRKDAGWTVSIILDGDGHGKWSKTKDLL